MGANMAGKVLKQPRTSLQSQLVCTTLKNMQAVLQPLLETRVKKFSK